MADVSVKTLTDSINIALTDEYLTEIEQGQADCYSTERVLRNGMGVTVRDDGIVRFAVLGEDGRALKRFEVRVREVEC